MQLVTGFRVQDADVDIPSPCLPCITEGYCSSGQSLATNRPAMLLLVVVRLLASYACDRCGTATVTPSTAEVQNCKPSRVVGSLSRCHDVIGAGLCRS